VTGIVIDASVTLSWCFPDEQTPMSLKVLDLLKAGERALVRSFWPLEILNILLLGERKRRITPQQTKGFFELYERLTRGSITRHWNWSPGRFRSSAGIIASRLMMRSMSNWPCDPVFPLRRWINRNEMRR